jgi:hypothetical protein
MKICGSSITMATGQRMGERAFVSKMGISSYPPGFFVSAGIADPVR